MLRKKELNELTIGNGLAGNTAKRIIRDYIGRMWIATSGGVSVFNGVKLESVLFEGEGGPHPFVYDICESPSDKSIYASTPNGIYVLSSGSKAFMPVLMNMPNSMLLCDKKRLYISNPRGFFVYESGRLRKVDIKGAPNVHCTAFSPEDSTVWMLTNDALCHYFPNESRLERRSVLNVFPKGVNFGSMAIIGNLFYVGTKNSGLFVYDIKNGDLRHVNEVGNVVSDISADADGNICVATDGGGAFLLDGATAGIMRKFGTDSESDLQLSTNAIYSYYRDSYGNDWFAQSNFGVSYTYHCASLFNTYHYGSFSTGSLNVRSFVMDGSRKLIGTLTGLYYIDESAGTVRHYTSSMLGGGNIVTCIELFAGKYYIGTYDGGLNVLDTKTLKTYPCNELNALTSKASVLTLKKKGNEELWVGTDVGIGIIDRRGTVRFINSSNSELPDCRVTGIMFASDGTSWINGSAGLAVISPQGRFLPSSRFPSGYFHKQQYMCSAQSPDGLLYFGSGGGVFHTNTKMTDYDCLKLSDGIITESCSALCFDNDGKLWMTTGRGLFRCNADGTGLQHFGYGGGITSALLSKDGISIRGDTLYVATSGGLLWGKLGNLYEWIADTTYHVFLYDTYVGDELIQKPGSYDINAGKSISLSWNIISQKLRFKAMLNDYAKPEGCFFEYRIEGRHQWKMFRYNEDVLVSGLSLGNHRLYVRQMGKIGTETLYIIKVRPSAIAYIELFLFILGMVLLWAWYRYYKNSRIIIKERGEIEDALVEMEQKAEELSLQQQDYMETKPEDLKTLKYHQMKLSEEECQDIVNRMRNYLETSRAYCNPELKRSDLAKVLHLTVAKLSYVFSMHLKVNYYEFINSYRLEEFKRLVAEGACSKFTITSLSEQCGFKKSSFFSTFHKVEGMTPTEYLKRQNIKIRL
ncbi:MAG: helix-turn-helix domain-containing protein [Prevotella sp.]